MGYGNNKGTYGRGNNTVNNTAAAGSKNLTAGTAQKSEAILTKLMRPTKSGKSVAAFTTGDEPLVIPANSRVVVTALSEKRIAKLEETAKERGFKGATPSHELAVFAIEQK